MYFMYFCSEFSDSLNLELSVTNINHLYVFNNVAPRSIKIIMH